MHSFKPNIILFETFSIIILYNMITPGLCLNEVGQDGFKIYQDDNITIQMCLDEIGRDGFNNNLYDTDENIRLHNFELIQQDGAKENIKTPSGIFYYKRLTDIRDAILPMIFCSWLYGNVGLCLNEVGQDGFKIYQDGNKDIRIHNYEHAYPKGAYRSLTTPHGKTYYKRLMIENDIYLTPTEFCESLYEQLNNNNQLVNYRTEIANIRVIFLCVDEIVQDGFKSNSKDDIRDIRRYNMERQQLYGETSNMELPDPYGDIENSSFQDFIISKYNFEYATQDRVLVGKSMKTPHGKIYFNRLTKQNVHVTPIYFCKWIYENHSKDVRWKNSKRNLDKEICLKQLTYDSFDMRDDTWHINLLRVTDPASYIAYIQKNGLHLVFKPIETRYGQEYASHMLKAKSKKKDCLDATIYCEHSSSSVSYNSRII